MILTMGLVVYNEEKHLALIEGNLRVLSAHKERVQVVVVDNASSDGSGPQLAALSAQWGFSYLRRSENNLGAARAEVVQLASTPWVGFVDADCSVNDAWISSALKRLREAADTTAAMGGPWVPAGPRARVYQSLFSTFFGHFNMPQIRQDEVSRAVNHIPTASVIYRRESLTQAGSFLAARNQVGEDLDLSYRLLSSGYRLVMVPDLKFEHHLPAGVGAWSRKIYGYGRARLATALEHGDFFSPIYVLPILYFVFLAMNLVFWQTLWGFPFLIYLLVAGVASFISGPSLRRGPQVLVFMVATHLSYALGMVHGGFTFIGEKIWRRKPLSPADCTQPSWEEI